MTFPLTFSIFGHPVLFHLITDILSTVVGVALYLRSVKGDSVSPENRQKLLIGAALGALVGSRLLGALENPTLFFHPPALLYYYASKTIIGGIAGGILGIELAKFAIGQRVSTGDRLTFPLLVAIIIGRVGCLFTGVIDGTVGNACSYAWCFNQGDGILRHPTSLYEIVFLILFFCVLRVVQKQQLRSGVLFRIFIIGYFALRFVLEFLKPIQPLVLSLSAIQIVCFLFVLWYVYDIRTIVKKSHGTTA